MNENKGKQKKLKENTRKIKENKGTWTKMKEK